MVKLYPLLCYIDRISRHHGQCYMWRVTHTQGIGFTAVTLYIFFSALKPEVNIRMNTCDLSVLPHFRNALRRFKIAINFQ